MFRMDIRDKLKSDEYEFLASNTHLGRNIILLALGGSRAYGTNTENSDIDIRGIALNSREDILLGNEFGQVEERDTDTVIYSFNKAIPQLAACNSNLIEMLGCREDHILFASDIGKELIENRKMFLSKICIKSFGESANGQARRLENSLSRISSQSSSERHILDIIEGANSKLINRYSFLSENSIRLYADKSAREGYDEEIFMDLNLSHYPLRDWVGMWRDMRSIVKTYDKTRKSDLSMPERLRDRDRLSKYMLHIIRLCATCIEILEKGDICTFREEEHDLLMSIRNGDYLDSSNQPTKEFFEMLHEYKKRLDYAGENTSLPKKPDENKINEFRMDVNSRVVRGE